MNETIELEKKNAAEAAVEEIESGMTIGLGTGSTAFYAIHKIGQKIKSGDLVDIKAVASSDATRALASELEIPIVSINEVEVVDITIDGADEFDTSFNLIKGGGGALLQEKIIAFLSKRFLVIADASKSVEHLGAFKLPVEVMQIAYKPILLLFESQGYSPSLRTDKKGENFVTDNGNYIIDCAFGRINDPISLGHELSKVPGVVETGLFLDMVDTIYMGINKLVSIVSRPERN